ncbi:HNH endonuclease [Streptomyces sp. NPDC058700]|uniref:HNH endonuclease n=1 Tax=Streptomyces sp. NPDC058700 TaxID=3346607 RepID=UPI0036619CB4
MADTTTPIRQVRAAAATRIGTSLDEYDAKITSGQKWCTKCKAWLPRSEFAKDRSRGDGLKSNCNSHYVRTTPGPTKSERRQRALLGQRWCRGCKVWLPASQVNRDGACRPCAAAEARAYYAGPAGEQIKALKNARKRGLDPIPPWWREAQFANFNGLCAYGCGAPAEVIDHVWPVARGGQSTPGNLVPACADCNGKKRDRNPTPWVKQGLTLRPGPWQDLVALALEHNTDNWLEEIING